MLSTSILAGSITEVLTNISSNLGQMRTTILLELLTSVGIIVMTSLLYVVLRDQNRAVALVALGLWMPKAMMLRAEDARPARPGRAHGSPGARPDFSRLVNLHGA